MKHWSLPQLLLPLLVVAVWCLHVVGVFLPETGFDAVWYHLPLIRAVAVQGGPVYLPELYQSTNPQLSDWLFVPGWWLAGEVGAKLTAYLLALSTVAISGVLARRWLSPTWTWVAVLLVSLMQVVAWQASSVYIDVAKAGWELLGLWCLWRFYDRRQMKWVWWGSLSWGASVASKLFSLALIPLWGLWLVWVRPKQLMAWLVSVSLVLVPTLPFYWWSYLTTGQPFVSVTEYSQYISEVGSVSQLGRYGFQQALNVWKSPWYLLIGRDYVNWLVVLVGALLPVYVRRWWADIPTRMALSLVAYQWLVWWFLPPLSTRYALSGFIVLVILVVRVCADLWTRNNAWRWALALTLSLSVVFHLGPRMVVLQRQLPYLLGHETRLQYLERFLDGNIDSQLRSWHQF